MHAIWFRNDLRTRDNPALTEAVALRQPIIALYFYTPEQHQRHGVGNNKLRFILETLAALSIDLGKLGIPLVAVRCSHYSDSVRCLLELCQKHGITQVFANHEMELNERNRDRFAAQKLSQHNIDFHRYHDQCLCEPGSVLTQHGEPFRVFTPFKRAWFKRATQQTVKPLPTPAKPPNQTNLPKATPKKTLLSWCQQQPANRYWPAGSQAAEQRLEQFVASQINHYKDQRDYPAIDATSGLSPHLAVGSISSRHCLYAALQANQMEWDSGNPGITCWISELIWREFYKHLSFLNPELSKGAAFQPHTENLAWNRAPKHFERWKLGTTGYPLVDAGMRQLAETGWMHNRLRMVTAMFLTKHLLIDWHQGEAYFMEQLIDGDYAANNGGWQWSASTGADAAPYFRIFNPQRQSERFDADGKFIQRWVPELAAIKGKAIHNPSSEQRKAVNYPQPMVDHAAAVARTKDVFKQNQQQTKAN